MHANRHTNLLCIFLLAPLGIMGAIPGSIPQGSARTSATKAPKAIEDRLRQLEDREEIRQLLVDYGRTLDRRDFAGFSKLFAENAEYVGGGGMGVTKGAAAIGKLLEEVFRKNPTGLRSPNFHLFANETIRVDGDSAVAISKGLFVVPNKANNPEMVMLATYEDVLVRENGRWKFKKRVVHGDIPAPPAP
jgi:uncharacterized protein (TIGR02246 family)